MNDIFDLVVEVCIPLVCIAIIAVFFCKVAYG